MHNTITCPTDDRIKVALKDTQYILYLKGTENLSYPRPKFWDLIPNEIGMVDSLKTFKLKIKNRIMQDCLSQHVT